MASRGSTAVLTVTGVLTSYVPTSGPITPTWTVALAPAFTAPPVQVRVVSPGGRSQLNRLVAVTVTESTVSGSVTVSTTSLALVLPRLSTVTVYTMSCVGRAVTGPLMTARRSGSGPPAPETTCVVTVSLVVKVVADLVPVTSTTLLRVVPLAATTLPLIVTVHVWKPWRTEALQVTRLPVWPQLPTELVSTSALVVSTPVSPTGIWSVSWTSVTLAPPVFVTTMV